MDVSNLSKSQFQEVVFDGVCFEMRMHQGRPKAVKVGRDVAIAGAKALLAAYQGLIERHTAMIPLLEEYDEVDIAGMIDAVQATLEAKERLHDLYRQHMNREWIADVKTLDKAYRAWRTLDGKVTKSAREVYEMFEGPIPDIKIPPIPLELWTKAIRNSGYFYYIKGALCAKWGISTTNLGAMACNVCRSHSDLVRFLDKNNYTMEMQDIENGVAYNSVSDLVGHIRRNTNPNGEDVWIFKYVNIYEGRA